MTRQSCQSVSAPPRGAAGGVHAGVSPSRYAPTNGRIDDQAGFGAQLHQIITVFDEAPSLEMLFGREHVGLVPVEQRELSDAAGHLKAHPQGPDVLQPKRRLLADDLGLVPWLPVRGGLGALHDGSRQLRAHQLTPVCGARDRPLI